jgi:hypothetical protein
MTSEHAKKIYRIKIAEQAKLFSAILCKIMQDEKKLHKKTSSKLHKTELVNGYLTSHLFIHLLIFDHLQAPPALKHLRSVIL